MSVCPESRDDKYAYFPQCTELSIPLHPQDPDLKPTGELQGERGPTVQWFPQIPPDVQVLLGVGFYFFKIF